MSAEKLNGFTSIVSAVDLLDELLPKGTHIDDVHRAAGELLDIIDARCREQIERHRCPSCGHEGGYSPES